MRNSITTIPILIVMVIAGLFYSYKIYEKVSGDRATQTALPQAGSTAPSR